MVTVGPLIGRESELIQLEGMLVCTQLLTVTGAGGCGKTRLALELADRVASAEDGPDCKIALLSSVADEEQLVEALLAVVGARERFGSRPTEVLFKRVAGRRLLLVLDNCEHLVAEVGRLTAVLLDAAPEVRVLATSREPLGIASEHVFRLGPLSLPDANGGVGAVVRSDAGRLFVDHAERIDPAFALMPTAAQAVARICRELDGLPLALGLAAARLDTLSVQEIADGLSAGGRLTASGDDEPSPAQLPTRLARLELWTSRRTRTRAAAAPVGVLRRLHGGRRGRGRGTRAERDARARAPGGIGGKGPDRACRVRTRAGALDVAADRRRVRGRAAHTSG